MKQFNITSLLIIIFMSIVPTSAFSQATYLEIDNQTPGWLSSKIGYGDQQTLENLKVSGYINTDDLLFIAGLMKNHSLHGRLDLEDVNIVSTTGGDNNYLSSEIWGSNTTNVDEKNLVTLQYFAIPKTLEDGAKNGLATLLIDTLFINTTTGYTKALNARVKHLVIGNNVTSLEYPSFRDVYNKTIETLNLPSTIKEIIGQKNDLYYNKIGVTIKNAKNLNNFPYLEYFHSGFKTEESPDSIYLPNIKVLSLDQYHDYHSSGFFKGGMHVFIGKKIELLTEMDHAYGIILHFSNPIPPVIESSYIYHYTPYNNSEYVLYVPKGSSDAYRACFASPGDKVRIYEEPDPVTIIANNCSRSYGDSNPTFTYTTEGETLVGTPEITCEATATSPVGTYPIVISKGSVTNDKDTYINGTLTITPAQLTVSAGYYTKRQGEDNPTFTANYEGFKNNETSSVLTKQPTFYTSVTKETAPGEYPVTVSGAEAQNYAISHISGSIKVLEANAIIIKADNKTISYGDAIPSYTYTVDGAELHGTPEIACEATSLSPVGVYPIIISKGSVSNYNDTYINGTLTIEKAPLDVSVGDYERQRGEENPIFNLTYVGFKNGENLSALQTIPQAKTDATKDSPEGVYDIIISGGEAVNYKFNYVNGTLTITTPTNIQQMGDGSSVKEAARYSTIGIKLQSSQRGINIVKMSDGSVKKVFVK